LDSLDARVDAEAARTTSILEILQHLGRRYLPSLSLIIEELKVNLQNEAYQVDAVLEELKDRLHIEAKYVDCLAVGFRALEGPRLQVLKRVENLESQLEKADIELAQHGATLREVVITRSASSR